MYGHLVFYKDANIIQSFMYIFANIREEETLLLYVILLEVIGLKRVKAYFSLISNYYIHTEWYLNVSSSLCLAISLSPLGAGKQSAMHYRSTAAFLLFKIDEGRGSEKTNYTTPTIYS